MSIPNLHIITVKYLGPTNFRGGRVKITSQRFGQSVIIPFDHALNNIEDMASAHLVGLGFNIVGLADGCVITDTFKPLKD